MGDSIVLSRLEKGSAPVTVHIPTSKQQHPISWLVQEIDSIQVEQKAVSCVSEKAKWWEGRRALDSRVERMLKEMEGLLGCWKSFLLPLSSDPELSKQARHLCKSLSAKGVTVSEEMLKDVLSASPVLSQEDLKRFALGVSPQWDVECDQLLHAAVSHLADRNEPNGHVVLILDKYLQKLPWESISILKSHSVSRMPSLHSLIGLSIQRETDSKSILKQGVDTKQVFYVLDPDANLGNSQDRFKEWFSSYVGHGAGARFLDSQAVLKRQMRAASLLFGCSSAALAVRGDQEGQGIILNYLIAGCPFVLGNLWDVTDRDIDRFTKALLESWLSAGSGAPLLDYMGPSRQATHLKHLIGAAPVVYGLPIYLLPVHHVSCPQGGGVSDQCPPGSITLETHPAPLGVILHRASNMAVNLTDLSLPQLEGLKTQLDQEIEFLTSSIGQLKVVQTKYVEAKDSLNILNKNNKVEDSKAFFKRKIDFLTKQIEKIQPALQEKHAMKQAVIEVMNVKIQQLQQSQQGSQMVGTTKA
ncbi:Separin [Nibea albiflora]|uniref:Separin n=1 Tax=Nibea albiflora TaxID=240163 RepID=A0ACB7F046_NIBAL|nr:Separin [Nibea albiflora]